MKGIPNSCRLWHNILNKDKPPTCAKSCFEPSGKPCADYKIQTVLNCPPSAVSNFLKPDSPVRRLIDIRKECSKIPSYPEQKTCTLCDLSKNHHPHNLCSSKCRPLSTRLHSKEYRQRNPPKRDYKHWVRLRDGTEVGRVFPMKFRIRRQCAGCSECKKELLLRETVTGNNDVLLLSNCCDVQIYPERKMINWHVVPVKMISEQEKMSKQVL
ncbi:hypothetical protein KR044_011070, partial [Drosophila immigrans]